MNILETKNEGLSREFAVTVPAGDIESRIESRLAEVGRTLTLPGFRPGKVPLSILKRRYGDAVLGEILEKTVSETTDAMISERALRPVAQPKVEISSFDRGADLVFTVGVELTPDITPMDFSSLKLTRLVARPQDGEVEEALAKIAANMRESEPVTDKRKSRAGDIAVINFTGRIDGEEFSGGSGQNHHLELGGGQFIPGFEDQVIGKPVGKSFDVSVTFPADYGNDELAGKQAVFETEITELRSYVTVAVDEELAKKTGFDTLAELRERLRERIGNEYAAVARERLKRDLLDRLAEAHDFEVPAGLLDEEFKGIWSQIEKARAEDQLDAEDQGKDEAVLKDEYLSIARRRVKLGLLLSHVGETAGITVTQEELRQAALNEARRHPGHEKQVLEAYGKDPNLMASLRAPLFEEKAVDYILELAGVEEREVAREELMVAAEGDAAATGKPAAKKATSGKTAKKAAKKAAKKKAAAKKAPAKA